MQIKSLVLSVMTEGYAQLWLMHRKSFADTHLDSFLQYNTEKSKMDYKCLLLSCGLLGIGLYSMAFNIDEKNAVVYELGKQDYFGFKVLQYNSGNEKWIIVSAPWGNNGTGLIYKCNNQMKCTLLPLQESHKTIKSIGMSMAVKSANGITACSPRMVQECYQTTYMNGICYQFDNKLELKANITPGYQECSKGKVDLVFLIDGSESVQPADFAATKDFILKIVHSLTNTSLQFAAMQFSEKSQTVFDFNDYRKGMAERKLRKEKQMRSLSNTYGAISHTLNKILTPEAGASEDATRVLLIITDDKPTDVDYDKVINKTAEKNIIRIVIMVGKEYVKNSALASEPENVFPVSNFAELAGLMNKLQVKIYNIEGTENGLSRKFTKEMSQSGFSAVYLEDILVLGSVGYDDWRGSLIKVIPSRNNEEIKDFEMEMDSYMGYSVTVGKKNRNEVYFSGAPRFEHTGQVVVFYKDNDNWTVKHREPGQQIGSYFGAELCALDVDSNGEVDFLLVGAPLYHEPQKEGRMYVYSLTAALELSLNMNISGSSLGRFASSISALQDLNGDGLQDVAVGAPLEDEHKGAVYIYLGERLKGIHPQFSQHITAQTMAHQLQFFGLSIDGKMDQGDDGLTDIVIGSKGSIVLLKSRPVLRVSLQVSLNPQKIRTNKFTCLPDSDKTFPVVTLTVCFNVTMSTQKAKGYVPQWMDVSYELNLDSTRPRSRAFLNSTDESSRRQQFYVKLNGTACKGHSVHMLTCVKDTLSPISIKINYSQIENEKHFSAILDPESNTVASLEVPFQSNCRNATCISDLELVFNFTTPTLLVIDQDSFNVTVSLKNKGDDSFNTSLLIDYPPGLSFSKITVIKETRKTLTNCIGPDDMINRTVCSVSLPVYQSETLAVFQAMFRISNKYSWNEYMEMTITPHSANAKSFNTSVTKKLPVQFGVDFAVKVLDEDSVTYLNFTPYERESKNVTHVFEVRNLGAIPLPVTVTVYVTTEAKHNFKMDKHHIYVPEAMHCGNITTTNVPDCKQPCQAFQFKIFSLKRGSPVKIVLSALAEFSDKKKYQQILAFNEDRLEVQFENKVKLSYDKERYVQTSSNSRDKYDPMKFHEAEIICQAEMIIPPKKAFIVGVGAGGGLFLLILIVLVLYKCGFFKKKQLCVPSEDTNQTWKNGEPVEHEESVNIAAKEGNSEVDTNPLIGSDEKREGSCLEDVTADEPTDKECGTIQSNVDPNTPETGSDAPKGEE